MPPDARASSADAIAEQVTNAILASERLVASHDFQSAKAEAERAVMRARSLPLSVPEYRHLHARAEESLGQVYWHAGAEVYSSGKEYGKAKEYLTETLKWLGRTPEGEELRILALYMLGGIDIRLDSRKAAVPVLEEAVKLDKDQSPEGIARRGQALLQLARLHQSLNNRSVAAERAEAAGDLLAQSAAGRGQALDAWALAGWIRLGSKDYSRAAGAYANALRIIAQLGDGGGEVVALYLGHAEALTELNRWEEARQIIMRSEEFVSRSVDRDLARLWKSIIQARLERQSGNASAMPAAVEQLIASGKASHGVLTSQTQWGLSYLNELKESAAWMHVRGQYSTAKRCYLEFLDRGEQIPSLVKLNPMVFAQIRLRLADVSLWLDETSAAAEHFESGFGGLVAAGAPQIVEALFGNSDEVEDARSVLDEVTHWRDIAFWSAMRNPESMGRAALLASALTKSLDDSLMRASRAARGTEPERQISLVAKKGELAGRILAQARQQSTQSDEGSVNSPPTPPASDIDRARRLASEPGWSIGADAERMVKELGTAELDLGPEAKVDELRWLAKTSGQDLLQRLRPGDALLEYFLIPQARPRLLEKDVPPAGGVEQEGYHYAVAIALGGDERVEIVDLGELRALDQSILAFHGEYERQASTGQLDEAALASVAEKLRRLLLEKLLLRAKGAKRIYVSAVGPIANVSFGVLPFPGEAPPFRYLAESFEWIYINSARDLLQHRPEKRGERSKEVILVGDPETGEAVAGAPGREIQRANEHQYLPTLWPRLKGTAALVNDIAAISRRAGFEVRPLSGAAARESAVKGLVSPYSLVFATHGFFLSNAAPAAEIKFTSSAGGYLKPTALTKLTADGDLRTMMILAGAGSTCTGRSPDGVQALATGCLSDDGYLTAYEAMEIDLRETELVVLFGCQTGLGGHRLPSGRYTVKELTFDVGIQAVDADDPMSLYDFAPLVSSPRAGLRGGSTGLRRAFEIAGARSLIASMWTIPFQPNRVAIDNFFEKWLVRGLTKYGAFREVELDSIRAARRDGKTHPFWWGGLVYIGDPSDVR